MKSAHLQLVSLCMILSSESGKHIYLNSALIHFGETSMFDIGRDMMTGWGGGEGMSMKEGKNMCHIYTHYLTWQRCVFTT